MVKPINLSVPALALALAGCASSQASTRSGGDPSNPITKHQVEASQRAWCDALLSLSESGRTGGDSKTLASKILSKAYNYDRGPVLFKPTLAYGAQTFRMDRQGALAYFVGGDPAYPNDSGFALQDWTKCRPEVRGVVQSGDMAVAMGHVHFENGKGDKVMVDKTFGYQRADDGSLVIVLHHSSLPFSPK